MLRHLSTRKPKTRTCPLWRREGDRPIFADFAAKIGTVPVNGYPESSGYGRAVFAGRDAVDNFAPELSPHDARNDPSTPPARAAHSPVDVTCPKLPDLPEPVLGRLVADVHFLGDLVHRVTGELHQGDFSQ